MILDGLTNILTTGQKIGQIEQVCNQIEECGGLDKIEMLQQSENEKVYKAALDIIEVISRLCNMHAYGFVRQCALKAR